MENKKLELEAEMGRLFLELEKARAFQAQAMQRINELRQQIEKLDEAAKG
jgi:exonuclease VII small subunit